MQAPSTISDFPHAPPSQLNPKRRFELENGFIEAAHFQQPQQKQPEDYLSQDQEMFDGEQPPNKKQRPGVTTNFLYKLTELAAYTSAVASEAYQTITGVGGPPTMDDPRLQQQHKQQLYFNNRYSIAVDGYGDDVMQIKAGAEEEFDANDEESVEALDIDNKKTPVDWSNINADEEEPPPPYDSSWSMPTSQGQQVPSAQTSVTFLEPTAPQNGTQKTEPIDVVPNAKSTAAGSRRRQIRVRRGNRPIRRKSSSTSLNASTNPPFGQVEQSEDVFLKFNCKLTDMIAEGRAALTSTVDVTEVEMMLAEEREREERIMRDLGIQAPVGRKHRRMTSSSSECDYFSSQVESSSYPGPNSSYSDYGFGNTSRSQSPTGYSTPGGYASSPGGAYSTTPTRYGSPNGYGSASGLFGGTNLGSALSSLGSSTLGSNFGATLGSALGTTGGGLYGSTALHSTYSGSASGVGGYSSHATGGLPHIGGSGVVFNNKRYY